MDFMIFRGGLAEKRKENFSFTGGIPDRGSVKHLERSAFFVCRNREIFFRTVLEHEFMEIAKDKKLATE